MTTTDRPDRPDARPDSWSAAGPTPDPSAGLTVGDAARDLFLGSSCLGCERPGRLLCPGCRAALPATAAPAWPTPVPGGLVEPWAAGPYAGTLRALVLGLKERQLLGVAPHLADLLAHAVVGDLVPPSGPGPPVLLLVPVPSSPRTVRQRGHDPTRTVTALAAARLRRRGYPAHAVPLLRQRRRVADQSGLDATQRALNLAGSMRCSRTGLRRLQRLQRSPRLRGPTRLRAVVCDDVLTTGSTAREAQRALEEAGLPVVRIAVVAATRLRAGGAG